jgi:hypothetical protein
VTGATSAGLRGGSLRQLLTQLERASSGSSGRADRCESRLVPKLLAAAAKMPKEYDLSHIGRLCYSKADYASVLMKMD